MLSSDTAGFTGDLLVTNTEPADGGTNVGGLSRYHVTNPAAPRTLRENYGDDSGSANKNAHETHTVFVDISNTPKPRFVAQHLLDATTDDAP